MKPKRDGTGILNISPSVQVWKCGECGRTLRRARRPRCFRCNRNMAPAASVPGCRLTVCVIVEVR